jgi:hypothetical protein
MTKRIRRKGIEVQIEKWESWYSQPAGEEKNDPLSYWFLQVYGIPKQDYLKEIERDHNPANARTRLLFKLMKSTSNFQKKSASGKRNGTQ